MKIPKAYLDIAETLSRNSQGSNKLSVDNVRKILGSVYHFKRMNIAPIIGELVDYNLIDYSHQYISLKIVSLEVVN